MKAWREGSAEPVPWHLAGKLTASLATVTFLENPTGWWSGQRNSWISLPWRKYLRIRLVRRANRVEEKYRPS